MFRISHHRFATGCGVAFAALGLASFVAFSQPDTGQPGQPPGAPKTPTTRALEAGARLLQGHAPLAPMDVYLVGFHPMKLHPQEQMEAHHYCRQVNEDFAQCVLFDGNTREARLNGVEYMISEQLFQRLPEAERKFWHPHNAEILSGQLVAPNIPAPAEKALMRQKMNSYGKTWHFWKTDAMGQPADQLPLGEAMLAWSFNRDGEARPALVERRDQSLKIDSQQKRKQREDLRALARPQSGVDDLRAAFPQATPIPGVVDAKAAGGAAPAPAGAPQR